MLLRILALALLCIQATSGHEIGVDDPDTFFNLPRVNSFPDENEINDKEDHILRSIVDCPEFFDKNQCTNECEVDEDYEQSELCGYISCRCVLNPNGLFNGDMKIAPANRVAVNAMFGRKVRGDDLLARGFTSMEDLIWPASNDGKVYIPYTLTNVNNKQTEVVYEAMAQYEKHTCIRFKRRTHERNYVDIFNKGEGGCWSYIGRIGGGQHLSLGPNCYFLGVVEHELMHALGFFHEQSRPDRDQHVRIRFDNIQNGKAKNFQKQTKVRPSISSYDLGSVMHYGEYAFSQNGKRTIEVIGGKPAGVDIGQRSGFSNKDIEEINAVYCNGKNPGPGKTTTTTTKPTTTTRAPQPTTTKRPGECQNLQTGINCKRWKSQGFCTHTHETYMKTNCKATCGFCDSTKIIPAECKDLVYTQDCLKNRHYCSHYKYAGWMSRHCAYTCKACQSSEVVTTSTRRSLSTAPLVTKITSAKCGKPVITRHAHARIVEGEQAVPGSIPWQVSLRFGRSKQPICGASIINSEWILTAAHCVSTKAGFLKHYYGYLGLHERKPDPNSEIVKEVKFSEIHVHAGYDKKTMQNDIALMKMNAPIEYSNYIIPVCLAKAEPATGTEVTVSGWGDVREDGTGEAAHLLKVDLPLQTNQKCNEWLNGAAKVTNMMICAGFEKGRKDSCQGDSGGPLTYKRQYDQTYYQVGVVSWGIGCARPKRPGVYVRVSAFRDWIHDVTGDRSL